ncbi:MAG: hypothetical protein VB031_02235 [Eubacteriaceae bacterium]|nr:hypothetical protein [Eubacteriaceae bacterium]
MQENENNNKAPKKKVNKKVLIISTAVGIAIAFFLSHFVFTDTSEYQIPDDINSYMASCKTISYDEMNRHSEKYEYDDVTAKGYVLQTLGTDGEDWVNLRIATDDWYNDILYIIYKPKAAEDKVLEGDTVQVWGEFHGMYEYKSTDGEKVQVPEIDAYHVKITKKAE